MDALGPRAGLTPTGPLAPKAPVAPAVAPEAAPAAPAAPTLAPEGDRRATGPLALEAAGSVDLEQVLARAAALAIYQEAAPTGEAWASEGSEARTVSDVMDLRDARLAGSAAAEQAQAALGKASEGLQAHWRQQGVGQAAKAEALLAQEGPKVAARFAKAIADRKDGGEGRGELAARWDRVGLPRPLPLAEGQDPSQAAWAGWGEPQLYATALRLFEQGKASGNWGPFEDYGRRVHAFFGAQAQLQAAPGAKELEGQARALQAERAPEEQAALARWPAADRAAYALLQRHLKGDPHTTLMLQAMALDGSLPGKKANRAGRSLMAELAGLAQAPLAPGVPRQELLSHLVRELALPTGIAQQGGGMTTFGTWTCTVTSGQAMMAIEQPAEYARIVAALASPKGEVRLAGGETLRRAAATEGGDRTGRTVSSRLWQGAWMDHAAQKSGATYLSHLDTNRGQQGINRGLNPSLLGQLYQAMAGRPGSLELNPRAGQPPAEGQPEGGAALLARTEAAVKSGRLVPASYLVREGVGHAVLVSAVGPTSVRYVDPMGLEKEVPRAEFERKLLSAFVPPAR